jgi:ubiquinone/menaquinone biosynthesis C-methylase UbiE
VSHINTGCILNRADFNAEAKGICLMYEYKSEDANWAAQYFDDFADKEWQRLTLSPADRVSFEVHAHYLHQCIRSGSRVLEIGSGPGRFTQVLSEINCKVLVSDVSKVQLDLHKQYSREIGFEDCVESRQLLDVCDLGEIEDESFDAVVVYGGPLSYVFENAEKALGECVRVCKTAGVVLTSSMSMWGTVHRHLKGVLAIPAKNNKKIVASGNVTKENFEKVQHQCHMYRSGELRELTERCGLSVEHMSASSCLSIGWEEDLLKQEDGSGGWKELVRMEIEASAQEGCLDMGTHIIVVGRKT